MATTTRVDGVFAAIGLQPQDEQVYGVLLDHPGVAVPALAEAAGLPPAAVRRTCVLLEAKGLLNRLPGAPPRYVPTPPDAAVSALVLRGQEELERARVAAAQFTDRYRLGQQQGTPLDLIEVIAGEAGVSDRFQQLLLSAHREVLIFDKPPYAASPETASPLELEILRRGVHLRALYSAAALTQPGQPAMLRELVAAGEEARTAEDLPMKLAAVDRRVALIPLRSGQAGVVSAILIHPSPLLDAVVLLFETIWASAVPLRFRTADSAAADAAPARLPGIDEQLLVLLAAGAKEQTIAVQLGISERTVERRITRIMQELNVRTKFQAGLQVALRGWLSNT